MKKGLNGYISYYRKKHPLISILIFEIVVFLLLFFIATSLNFASGSNMTKNVFYENLIITLQVLSYIVSIAGVITIIIAMIEYINNKYKKRLDSFDNHVIPAINNIENYRRKITEQRYEGSEIFKECKNEIYFTDNYKRMEHNARITALVLNEDQLNIINSSCKYILFTNKNDDILDIDSLQYVMGNYFCNFMSENEEKMKMIYSNKFKYCYELYEKWNN